MKEIAHLMQYMPCKESDALEEKPLQLEDEGELSYELAPYQEGQSERFVHWKLVAQRDIYMVREREDNIKLRKEHLVMIDPIFLRKKVRKMYFKRFLRTHRLRRRWAKEREKACYRDKVVTTCMSYLYSLLSQETNVIWMGYNAGQWEQRILTKPSDLEQIEEMLCKSYFIPTLEKSQRWPQFEMNQCIEKTLLTTNLDATLKEYIKEEALFKAIWIQEDAATKLSGKSRKKNKKHLVKRTRGREVHIIPYSMLIALFLQIGLGYPFILTSIATLLIQLCLLLSLWYSEKVRRPIMWQMMIILFVGIALSCLSGWGTHELLRPRGYDIEDLKPISILILIACFTTTVMERKALEEQIGWRIDLWIPPMQSVLLKKCIRRYQMR